METSKFQAILGCAGVGKSTAINLRLKEDSKFCFRTATSGVAAINMSSAIGGNTATTINSALGYFNSSNLLYKVVYQEELLNQNIKRIANNFKYLALDEISMMESAQLDLIYLAITRYNTRYNADLGIIVLGDPGQLPAVSGQPFFTAKCWNKFNITYLTEVKRQKDKDFINALALLRQGKASECADWFVENINFSKQIDWDFQGSTFFSTNREVDEYNYKSLNKIPSKPKRYRAVILGTPHPSWKDIPQYVELKQGALIQILVNNLEGGYANGDMGFIDEMYDSKLMIRLLRTGRVIYIDYVVNKNTIPGGYKSIGSIRRMPVRLAYSVSCHKCQGLTLDAAQVSLKSNNFLSTLSGGLYTALSRVRTKEGLRVVGSKDDFINTCFIDERYKQWIK